MGSSLAVRLTQPLTEEEAGTLIRAYELPVDQEARTGQPFFTVDVAWLDGDLARAVGERLSAQIVRFPVGEAIEFLTDTNDTTSTLSESDHLVLSDLVGRLDAFERTRQGGRAEVELSFSY
jgi:hypothetical protein